MKEFAAFLVVSLGVHLGAFWASGLGGGAESAGARGEVLISLQGAGGDYQALARDWLRPPMAAAAAAELAALPEAATVAAPPPVPSDSAPAFRRPAAPPAPAARRDPPLRTRPAAPPPAEARPASKPPAPRQRAAGSGETAAAGRQAAAPAAAQTEARRRSLLAEWGGQIRARIEQRKRYPAAARRASGTARLRISLGRDGRLAGLAVIQSSGTAALDRAALDAVRAAGRFPPAPRALAGASFTFDLPVTFSR